MCLNNSGIWDYIWINRVFLILPRRLHDFYGRKTRFLRPVWLISCPIDNHNIPVGAGFWDCQLLAGIVGEPSPTKIPVARPDMIWLTLRRLGVWGGGSLHQYRRKLRKRTKRLRWKFQGSLILDLLDDRQINIFWHSPLCERRGFLIQRLTLKLAISCEQFLNYLTLPK